MQKSLNHFLSIVVNLNFNNILQNLNFSLKFDCKFKLWLQALWYKTLLFILYDCSPNCCYISLLELSQGQYAILSKTIAWHRTWWIPTTMFSPRNYLLFLFMSTDALELHCITIEHFHSIPAVHHCWIWRVILVLAPCRMMSLYDSKGCRRNNCDCWWRKFGFKSNISTKKLSLTKLDHVKSAWPSTRP